MYNTILLYDDAPKTRGLQQVRVKCQTIAEIEPTGYSMEALKTDCNEAFTDQGVDVIVTGCRQIRTAFTNNLIIDMSVPAESPIAILSAILIIAVLTALTASILAIVHFGAMPLIERLYPQNLFYAQDGTSFTSLAEYITYQQSLYPTKYICFYCGQAFDTAELRDTHQESCPWKEGPPDDNGGGLPGLVTTVLLGALVITGVAVVVPRLLKT